MYMVFFLATMNMIEGRTLTGLVCAVMFIKCMSIVISEHTLPFWIV